MKLIIFGLAAIVAVAYAQYAPSSDYLPPSHDTGIDVSEPQGEYLAPAVEEQQTVLADDGYRYKTVRRHRQRREVNSEYLPPTQEASIEFAAPSNEYFAPEEHTVVADDGYRYKTVRRLRHRQRREVNSEYLPPNQEASIDIALPSNEYLAPEEHTVVADDGYRYKTVRRLRHRQRREVNTEYLPPHQEISQSIEIAAPSNEYLAPEEHTVVADDGYRYKTVRRLRHRQRREVNTEYLPPHQEVSQSIEFAAPSNEYSAPEEHTVVADDGYRYKTVRRLRHRQRRDVNELNAEYLPPHQEVSQSIEFAAPSNEYLAPEEHTVVANDGYRYKTVRRLRHRQRREVNTEYLPPNQEASFEIAAPPSNEYLAPEEHTVVADDGYRYKTVRRLRHRQRREVNTEYLPPHHDVSQSIEFSAPSNEYFAPAEETSIVANDGYRYKTVRKFKIRRH